MTTKVPLILSLLVLSGRAVALEADHAPKPGLSITALDAPPADDAVIISQALGRKGPTSIRYHPPAERKMKASHNPTDPKGAVYATRDRDLGQTFTVPDGPRRVLRAVTLRLGTGGEAPTTGAEGAEVLMQIFALDGEAVIHDNGTTEPGMTVSKGYPGQPMADDYLTGETYTSLLVATGGVLPAVLTKGENNTRKPTNVSRGTLLRFDLSGAGQVVLEPGRRYAFLVGFAGPAVDRGLPLDNWDYINLQDTDEALRRTGPYAGGHAIRREGRVGEPWQHPEKVFGPDPLIGAFPTDPADRFAQAPGTWGRPDVDTWRDLVFWLETPAAE